MAGAPGRAARQPRRASRPDTYVVAPTRSRRAAGRTSGPGSARSTTRSSEVRGGGPTARPRGTPPPGPVRRTARPWPGRAARGWSERDRRCRTAGQRRPRAGSSGRRRRGCSGARAGFPSRGSPGQGRRRWRTSGRRTRSRPGRSPTGARSRCPARAARRSRRHPRAGGRGPSDPAGSAHQRACPGLLREPARQAIDHVRAPVAHVERERRRRSAPPRRHPAGLRAGSRPGAPRPRRRRPTAMVE